MLQQYLPLAVLKHPTLIRKRQQSGTVATVLTACGIETLIGISTVSSTRLQQYLPLAVLKHNVSVMWAVPYLPCCNSTYRLRYWNLDIDIVKEVFCFTRCNSTYRLRYWNKPWLFGLRSPNLKLQQYFPLAVLKLLEIVGTRGTEVFSLQQYLPLAVLKLIIIIIRCRIIMSSCNSTYRLRYWNNANLIPSSDTPRSVATVLTACGIETWLTLTASVSFSPRRCNSTYRLRYWNLNVGRGTVRSILLQQYLPLAVLKLGRYWQVYH